MSHSSTPAGGLVSTLVADADLLGLAEVSELIGRPKRSTIRLTKHPTFPKPIAELAATKVWARADVERWAREVLPTIKPGRPPQHRAS